MIQNSINFKLENNKIKTYLIVLYYSVVKKILK